jgi:hypothetical protein
MRTRTVEMKMIITQMEEVTLSQMFDMHTKKQRLCTGSAAYPQYSVKV